MLSGVWDDFEADASRAFSNIEGDARDAAFGIGDQFELEVEQAQRALEDIADQAAREFDRVEREAAGAADGIDRAFSASLVRMGLKCSGSRLRCPGAVLQQRGRGRRRRPQRRWGSG